MGTTTRDKKIENLKKARARQAELRADAMIIKLNGDRRLEASERSWLIQSEAKGRNKGWHTDAWVQNLEDALVIAVREKWATKEEIQPFLAAWQPIKTATAEVDAILARWRRTSAPQQGFSLDDHCPPLPRPDEALVIEPDWWIVFDWVRLPSKQAARSSWSPVVWQFVLGEIGSRTHGGNLTTRIKEPGYYGSVARALKGYLVCRARRARKLDDFAEIAGLAVRAARVAAGEGCRRLGEAAISAERAEMVPG